ncbi:xyloside xylosyltransferase 1-like [Patiria miniata]|uniref:Xyloside xylosyltransferase 1 n=1 Tax=Patiria miniata TaxID=46514 RepID=A0A914ADD1_PATMI|nr:xyloside xylosyltransferase 1-like [Patiria miniata]
MVRQRKHDGKNLKQSGRLQSAKQESRPQPLEEASTPPTTTAADGNNMQYVSNSRSKARLQQFGPQPGFLRWLLRLRLTRAFFMVMVVGVSGFLLGRMVHRGHRVFIADPQGGFQAHKNLRTQQNLNHPNTLNQGDAQHRHANAKNGAQLDAPIQQPFVHHEAKHEAKEGEIPMSPEEQRHFQEVYDKHAAMRKKAKEMRESLQKAGQQNAAQPQAIVPQQQPPHVGQQPDVQNQNGQQPAANLPSAVETAKANQPKIADAPSDFETYPYHVIQTLTNTHKMPHLKTRFIECTKSILDKASINLHFFFVVDEPSKKFIIEALQDITNQHIARNKFQFHFIEVDELARQLAPLVSMLQEKVTGGHPYYQDAIFFLSVAIHRGILPSYVRRIVMLDSDLKFMTDIKKLFDRFDLFTSNNIMGLAREMQPVYRHLLSLYRNMNQGTKVGDPPPDGLTGFNSGVVLLDLEKMRNSAAYRGFVNAEKIHQLTEKYHFKGHLGDQDFFTLISLDMPDLFHILPCSWNRQLCTWWRDKGYANVFDQYYRCDMEINVYHGNCNTPIP